MAAQINQFIADVLPNLSEINRKNEISNRIGVLETSDMMVFAYNQTITSTYPALLNPDWFLFSKLLFPDQRRIGDWDSVISERTVRYIYFLCGIKDILGWPKSQTYRSQIATVRKSLCAGEFSRTLALLSMKGSTSLMSEYVNAKITLGDNTAAELFDLKQIEEIEQIRKKFFA